MRIAFCSVIIIKSAVELLFIRIFAEQHFTL